MSISERGQMYRYIVKYSLPVANRGFFDVCICAVRVSVARVGPLRVLRKELFFTTFPQVMYRCMDDVMFFLGWLSLAVLYELLHAFWLDFFYGSTTQTVGKLAHISHSSRQLFIQGPSNRHKVNEAFRGNWKHTPFLIWFGRLGEGLLGEVVFGQWNKAGLSGRADQTLRRWQKRIPTFILDPPSIHSGGILESLCPSVSL